MTKKIAAVFMAALVATSVVMAAKQISTTQSAEVAAPADAVWALLKDVNNWAEWNPAVLKAKIKKGDGESLGTVVKFNPMIGDKKGPPVKLTLTKSEKNKVLEYSSDMPGLKVIFGFSIEPSGDKNKVTSYETITGPGVAGFEVFGGQEALDIEHRQWVEAIKKKLEGKQTGG